MAQLEDEFRSKLRKAEQMEAFKMRRQELRDEGASAKDSWLNAAIEFGYDPHKPRPKKEPKPEVIKARKERIQYVVDRLQDKPSGTLADQLPEPIAFTMQNLHRIGDVDDVASWDIDPHEAPSVEAWNMLTHVAQNDNARKSFMDKVLQQLMLTQRENGRQEVPEEPWEEPVF